MLLNILVFLCIIFSPYICSATPSISSISGTVGNGNSITIHGSNLYNTSGGSKNTPGPLLSSYDHTTTSNNWHSGVVGGDWTFRVNTVMASSSPRTTLYQSDHYANCPYDGNYNDIRWDDSNISRTNYYVSTWYRATASQFLTSSSGSNSKNIRYYPYTGGTSSFMMEYMCDDSGPCEVYSSPNGIYMSADDGATGSDSANIYVDPDELPMQQWYHLEIWLHAGFSSGDHYQARVWVNGKYQGNMNSKYFSCTHDANYWRWGVVSGGNQHGGSIYVDQIFLDSEPAHVFISNKGDITDWLSYSSTAHNEVQVANTTWNDTTINITLNQGSFTNFTSDGRYLYVVDSNGAISNAYDLSGGGGDTDDPSVTISALIPDPSSITSDSLYVSGTASDAVWGTGSVCKWRLTSAPDADNGTTITGLTYSGTVNWSATASGFSRGANTLYVGCRDAAGNWGSDSMVVNYLPVIQGVTGLGISFR